MKRLALVAVLLPVAMPAQAASLAPPRTVEIMLGDVSVMANARDDRCTVSLYEDKVKQGYRLTFFDDGGKCAKAFPVMAKVVAWRVYKDGTMAFADAAGGDLITFRRGKGYQRLAVKKVDGIKRIWSQQEFAE